MSEQMESATIAGRAQPLSARETPASTLLTLLGYLAALVAMGVLAAAGAPTAAAIGHGVLLVVILTHAGARLEKAKQVPDALGRGLCGLALVPLLGLVGTALTSDLLPAPAHVVLVALFALVGAVLVARILDLTPAELGVRRGRLPVQLGVGLTGIPLGLLALVLGGGRAFEPLAGSSPILLVPAILLAAAVQELVFRGVLATTFAALFGRAGIVCTSALFAVAAVGTGSVGLVVALLVCGLVWAWARERTGSIAGTTVAHALVAGGLAFLPPPALG
ncbi:MAG: CPBP family intramembrane metalloprotease [Actinomycetota bacterium]|nr:CPBP family intramembrane metalloprotease [Actinomycetota bacterium]